MRNIRTNRLTEVIFAIWRAAWTKNCSIRCHATRAWWHVDWAQAAAWSRYSKRVAAA